MRQTQKVKMVISPGTFQVIFKMHAIYILLGKNQNYILVGVNDFRGKY